MTPAIMAPQDGLVCSAKAEEPFTQGAPPERGSDTSDGVDNFVSLAERFEKREVIGSGVYGTVFKARDREKDMLVALKLLRFDDEEAGDGVPAHVIREVSALRGFKHPNIVHLLGLQITGLKEICLVFEYVEVDLHQVLKSFRQAGTQMPMDRVRRHARELISGVSACHIRFIIHRDLKPQNILVHAQDGLKICDFGLARNLSKSGASYTNDVITLWYRAPEVLLGKRQYGLGVDVWSSGCIVAEMATGDATFPGDCEVFTLYKIFSLLGTPTAQTWPEYTSLPHYKAQFPQWPPTGLTPIYEKRPELEDHGIDFLSDLLCMNPRSRVSGHRALRHNFLAGYEEAPL